MPNAPEDKLDLLRTLLAAKEHFKDKGPIDDDTLHAWVQQNVGIDIPRVSVCPDHNSPFEFISDLYFNRITSALLMANRGGSKTFMVALLHFLNSTFKPGYWGLTFGATKAQSKRAYEHLTGWVYERKTKEDGSISLVEKDFIEKSIEERTQWNNSSKVEIVTATVKAVNGPHPNLAHADEVEQIEDEPWQESQPVDTLIPTPSGHVRMGDLKVGDSVIGSDGRSTRVNKVWELGVRDVYEVELSDRRITRCCGDHLWRVSGPSQARRGVWRDERTSDIVDSGLQVSSGSSKFCIPRTPPVEHSVQDLPIDPYVLGILLGDGSFGDTSVTFRSSDSDIVDYVRVRLDPEFSVTERTQEDGYSRFTIARNESETTICKIIDTLGLSGTRSATKFIPDKYKFASREQRIDLLRGLLDSDGHAARSGVQFASVSERLASDVRDVVFGLGGKAVLRNRKFKSEWSEGILWTVDASLLPGDVPFLCARKASKHNILPRQTNPFFRSIRPVGTADVRCIGVDAEDGLYLTESYIVTHNSRNMALAGRTTDGREIPAQDVLTSTRKHAGGKMQKLLDLCAEAVKKGFKPPYAVYKWCVFETTKEIPICQNIPLDVRKARIEELNERDGTDIDPCSTCDCDQVAGGSAVWGEDGPIKDYETGERWYYTGDSRTLATVCRGRFFKSRGWRPLAEVQNTFQQNNQATWDAQQECTKPSTEGNYLLWDASHDEVYDFKLDPDNGPIYMGVDWGGTNPHAVMWMQRLNVGVQVKTASGTVKVIPDESIVVFDEIYTAEISVAQLAEQVKEREAYWRRECRKNGFTAFRVSGRFMDPQGKPHKLEFKRQGMKGEWPVKTRDWEFITRELTDIHENGFLYVDPERCPNICSEVLVWRKNPKTGNQIDEFNHAIDAVRYAVANVNKIDNRAGKTATSKKASGKKYVPNASRRGAVGSVGRGSREQTPFFNSDF